MQACEIFIKGDNIFVISSHKTIPGFWISGDPMMCLSRTDRKEKIGKAVLSVLSSSRENEPLPADLKSITKGLLRFVGAKTWKKFTVGAKCYVIEYEAGLIKLIPTTRTNDGGFDHIPAAAQIIRPEPVELGEFILQVEVP